MSEIKGAALHDRTALEAMELWKTGCELWLDYLTALPSALTPGRWLELNCRLFAGGLQLSGLAAGELLRDEGLRTPLLNES